MKLRNLLAGSSAHPQPPPPAQCVKITIKQTRCKFPPLPGDDLCALHREIANEKLAS